jgi:hypothetical protein
MRLTKQDFFDRLGPTAVSFLLTAAKTEVSVEAWIKRLDLTTPDPDGTSVDLLDQRTIEGVTQLGAMMTSLGIVDAGWIDSVLSAPTHIATPEHRPFVVTHTVQDFGLVMVEVDGTVRFADGRWTTLDALASMGKIVETI